MSKIVYTRETTNDDIGTVETFYEAQADELSGETLSPYFDSSESVTKSLNESGNIEFSVNADIVQKVERAILTPVDTPSEDVVPVVDSTNVVSYKPLSEIGGGGGGGGGGKTLKEITFTNHNDLKTWAFANYTKIYKVSIAQGGVVAVTTNNYSVYFTPDATAVDAIFFSNSIIALEENQVSIDEKNIKLITTGASTLSLSFGRLDGSPLAYTPTIQTMPLSDLDAAGIMTYIVEYFE